MASYLVTRLTDELGLTAIDADSHDEFVTAAGACVLFFAGDAARHPEVNDVAVVLPELLGAFSARLRAGVVAPVAEKSLAARYGVAKWPSLVFLRGGAYLGVLTGMRDWTDFCADVDALLAREPGRAPSVGIPVVEAGPATGEA